METQNVHTDQSLTQIKSIGDILENMLSGNSPLAKGYRNFLASKKISEKGDVVLCQN